LLLLARYVLGGPTDDGRASCQVALDVCEDCGRARQCADGELIDVAPAVAAMAECDAQHLPSAHAGVPANAPRPRAAQEVPPAVRRSVLRRDHHRCQVPGCTQATFVDVHHLVARADGGKHHPTNLLTLCGAHHRAVHEGTLVIGGWGSALLVRHADGTPYGAAPSAPLALVQERAFRALRGLGFAERDARRALKRCIETLDSKVEPELEGLLRHCLELLTANASMKAS
jgi:hypothetical protein